MISLVQYVSKKQIHPPTNHQPEPVTTIALEPMKRNPNDEIQHLKVENAVLQEREKAKQTQIKNLDESYASLKKSTDEEMQRLRNEVSAQERRYQQRLEEDLLLERQRREEERKTNRELLQRMMQMEDGKRKSDEDEFEIHF